MIFQSTSAIGSILEKVLIALLPPIGGSFNLWMIAKDAKCFYRDLCDKCGRDFILWTL